MHYLAARAILAMLALDALLMVFAGTQMDEKPPLKAELSSPKSTILVGEPLVYDITIMNASKDTITVEPIVYAGESTLSRWIESPEGEVLGVGGGPVAGGGRSGLELAPGDTYIHRELICQLGENLFSYAGQWRLFARYRVAPFDTEPWFPAEPLDVQVVEPQGRAAEACEMFKPRWWRDDFLELLLDEPNRTTLATEFFDTPYGQYAAYSLAMEKAGRAPLNPATMEIDYNETLSLLEPLTEAELNFPLAPTCLQKMAQCFAREGRAKEKYEALQRLLTEHKGTPEADKTEASLGNFTWVHNQIKALRDLDYPPDQFMMYYEAMVRELTAFLNVFPNSESADEARALLEELEALERPQSAPSTEAAEAP